MLKISCVMQLMCVHIVKYWIYDCSQYIDHDFFASSQAVFEQTGLENEAASTPSPSPSAFGAMASFLVPKLSVGLAGSLSNERSSSSADQSKIIKKERHAVRPPVKHNWSLPGSVANTNPPQIFQHELLQNFSINMFCKVWALKTCVATLIICILHLHVAHLMSVACFAVHYAISCFYCSSVLCGLILICVWWPSIGWFFSFEFLHSNILFRILLQIPVNKVRTYGDLRNVLMKRIFLSALHFRINTRYKVCCSTKIFRLHFEILENFHFFWVLP